MDFENTDVNIDGSATVINGPNAELGAIGYPSGFQGSEQTLGEVLSGRIAKNEDTVFQEDPAGNTSDPMRYHNAGTAVKDSCGDGKL